MSVKENNELERKDMVIDGDMEVDCDEGKQVTVYIETWFDTDKKFMVHTDTDDGAWINMYARYNPFENSLKVECVVSRKDVDEYFEYNPTKTESDLIKEMITEKIKSVYDMTPQEFCNSFTEESNIEMGGIK